MHDFDWFIEHGLTVAREDSSTPGARDVFTNCPVHGGSDSLHLTEKNGKVLVAPCFSCGAKYAEVVAALEGADESPRPPVIHKRRRTVTAQDAVEPMAWWVGHTGVSEDIWLSAGVEVDGTDIVFTFPGIDAQKRRYQPTEEDAKGIRWRGRLRPALWPLPSAVVEKEVHLCVGESDCGALLACGFDAYCLTKGDAGTSELFKALRVLKSRGAEYVVVWTDADKSGRDAREAIVDAVQAVGLPAVYPDTDDMTDPLTGEKDVNDLFRRLGPDALISLAKTALVDVPQPPRTLTHAEMMAAADETVEYDIPDLVSPGEKGVIAGPAKARKTFIALDMVRSLRRCTPFMAVAAWTPSAAKRVMYLGEEGVKQKFARRVRALGIPRDDDGLVWKHRTQFNLLSEARVTALIEELRAHRTDVLFIDPFQRVSGGVDENSAQETGPVWDAIARIQGVLPRLTVWVIFHAGKDGDRALTLDAIRGSSRHSGELDVALIVKKEDEEHSLVTVEGRDLPPVQATGSAMRVHFDIDLDASVLDVRVVGVQVFKVTRVRKADRTQDVADAVERSGAAGVSLDELNGDPSLAGINGSSIGKYISELVKSGIVDCVVKPTRGRDARYASHRSLAGIVPRDTNASDAMSRSPSLIAGITSDASDAMPAIGQRVSKERA